MQLFYLIQFVVVSSIYIAGSRAECPIKRGEDIFLLSSQRRTFQAAEERCSSLNGQLAQIKDQDDRMFFQESLKKIYFSDELDLINIKFIGSTIASNYRLFKFRSSISSNDPTVPTSFQTPADGDLRSIYLYNRSNSEEGFDQAVVFCYFENRDAILRLCDGDWNPNFLRYGGTAENRNTIRVYNYLRNSGEISSLLSLKEMNLPLEASSLYLPDISVFTGARSDVGQSNWFWNNETMITDPSYPTSNPSVCQQMTWPLTYDDGINLRAKECGSGESHYICRVEASLAGVECDGTSLRLSVSALIAGNSAVEIKIIQTDQIIPSSSQQTILGNLTKQTTYDVEVRIILTECSGSKTFTTTTLKGTTTYGGEPKDVSSASVEKSSSEPCVVTWEYDFFQQRNVNFMIYASWGDGDMMNVSEISTTSDNGGTKSFQHNVLLSAFPTGSVITFKIRALSCGGSSSFTEVRGYCFTPLICENELPWKITALASAGVLALLILVSGIYWLCRKIKSRKETLHKSNRRSQPRTPTSLNNASNEGRPLPRPSTSHQNTQKPRREESSLNGQRCNVINKQQAIYDQSIYLNDRIDDVYE